jgi:hypothetical protein
MSLRKWWPSKRVSGKGEHDGAQRDERSSGQLQWGKVLAKEEPCPEHHQDDAEFVDRSHARCRPHLQGTEVAQPGEAGADAGQHQKQRRLISDSAWCFSRLRAIAQVKTRMTLVRMAVARLESMPEMPTLASSAVAAAKSAERSAQKSQVIGSGYSRWEGKAGSV